MWTAMLALSLTFLAPVSTVRDATAGARGNCTALADQWRNSPAAGSIRTAPGTLVAADAPAGKGGRPSWRCYNPESLETIRYGGDCKGFCTRAQLATI
eukprot:COSAG02_NODE_1747_length_11077_cov_31.871470_3_plen_98_part_00